MKEARPKQPYRMFPLYKLLECNHTGISGYLGLRYEREGFQRSIRKLEGGVMNMFIISIVVTISQGYTFDKTDQIAHFKCVYVIVYQLHLTRGASKIRMRYRIPPNRLVKVKS